MDIVDSVITWIMTNHPDWTGVIMCLVGLAFFVYGLSVSLPKPGAGPAFTKAPWYALLYRTISTLAVDLRPLRKWGSPKLSEVEDATAMKEKSTTPTLDKLSGADEEKKTPDPKK